MSTNPAKPSRINKWSRCTHLSAAGSRCRSMSACDSGGKVPGEGSFAGKQVSTLCAVHAKADAERREAAELAAILTGDNEEFTSATPINQFLSRLLVLLAQDRIPPRRGAVMAYTANLLLHSLRAIERENIPPEKVKLPPRVIWTFDTHADRREPIPTEATVTPPPKLSEPARPEASQFR